MVESRSHLRTLVTLMKVSTIGGALLLGGCASLSEGECRTADWGQLGHRAGSAGSQRSVFAAQENACGKVGIRADANSWFGGYERGIKSYCTPQRGFDEGLRDAYYRGVCPADLEPAFLERLAAGREVFRARRTLAEIDSEIASLEQSLLRPELKYERRLELMTRLQFQRLNRIHAAQQVQQVEMWARGANPPSPQPAQMTTGR